MWSEFVVIIMALFALITIVTHTHAQFFIYFFIFFFFHFESNTNISIFSQFHRTYFENDVEANNIFARWKTKAHNKSDVCVYVWQKERKCGRIVIVNIQKSMTNDLIINKILLRNQWSSFECFTCWWCFNLNVKKKARENRFMLEVRENFMWFFFSSKPRYDLARRELFMKKKCNKKETTTKKHGHIKTLLAICRAKKFATC